MKLPITERRQIENEMIFRRGNEKVGIALDEIDAMHRRDGNLDLVRAEDMVLQFKCECSDENCTERIPIALSVYQKIHLDRDTFIIKLRHQVDAIEKVIFSESAYSVVRKNNSTSEPIGGLKVTTAKNAASISKVVSDNARKQVF